MHGSLAEVRTAAASDMELAFVRFEGVQKTYDGETLVVKDLNLDVARGEFLTMLGPSGSGKTTSLMMLAGFEATTSGNILIANRSINLIPPHKRGIGMVFQNYALFPHMTILENLAFPLSVRKYTKAEISEKVRRALDLVELSAFGERKPAQLSGGQQQRVALARALVFKPELVLMDEPLGALDKQLREQMQYEIKHIHERLGVTIVYVTHDQSEALTMSDRIAVFNNGVVQQLSAPSELYERPQTSFVAQFIGENNKLTGVLQAVRNDACTVILEDGTALRALPVNIGEMASKTLLSVRPERVVVNPPKDPGFNTVDATVEELIYLGDHLRLRLRTCCTDQFILKIPNADQHPTFQTKTTIEIGWRVADCHALDA